MVAQLIMLSFLKVEWIVSIINYLPTLAGIVYVGKHFIILAAVSIVR